MPATTYIKADRITNVSILRGSTNNSALERNVFLKNFGKNKPDSLV